MDSIDTPVTIQRTDAVLTLTEVAARLRCSRAHVSNLINGRVPGAPRLLNVRLGRRKVVRESTLQGWMIEAEEVTSKGSDKLETAKKIAVNA